MQLLAIWIQNATNGVDDEAHEDAVLLALTMLAGVADSKNWSDTWLEYGSKIITWSDSKTLLQSPAHFWESLVSGWSQVSEQAANSGSSTPPNWENLGRAFVAARDGQLRAESAPDGLDYAWDFVVESAQDLRSGVETAGQVAVGVTEAATETAKAGGSLLSGKGGQILAGVAGLFLASRLLK